VVSRRLFIMLRSPSSRTTSTTGLTARGVAHGSIALSIPAASRMKNSGRRARPPAYDSLIEYRAFSPRDLRLIRQTLSVISQEPTRRHHQRVRATHPPQVTSSRGPWVPDIAGFAATGRRGAGMPPYAAC